MEKIKKGKYSLEKIRKKTKEISIWKFPKILLQYPQILFFKVCTKMTVVRSFWCRHLSVWAPTKNTELALSELAFSYFLKFYCAQFKRIILENNYLNYTPFISDPDLCCCCWGINKSGGGRWCIIFGEFLEFLAKRFFSC